MTAIPAKVANIVRDRAQGRCEGCGAYADTELHHRVFRSRGGAHSPQNLIALCGWGNHTGCHGAAHSGRLGAARGWAVHSWHNPAEVPVWRFDAWWLLTDGEPLPLTPDEAAELRALYGMEAER